METCLYCDYAPKSRGLCSAHYMRWINKLPMEASRRNAVKIPLCHPDKPYHSGGKCSTCYQRDYMAKERKLDPAKHAKNQRNQRAKIKQEFIDEYGGKCNCCGEATLEFLTLEHKKKDGALHRKKFRTTTQMLADLRRRGWPKEDYEILCYNCNMGSKLGKCPHKKIN